jgi:hypothetical protein
MEEVVAIIDRGWTNLILINVKCIQLTVYGQLELMMYGVGPEQEDTI